MVLFLPLVGGQPIITSSNRIFRHPLKGKKMISLMERIEYWMYKKAPRVLTFFQQFTIMEWTVLILVALFVMERV